MSELKIRAATGADLEAVQTLLADAALPLEGVADFFPGNYAVVERENEVLGAIGVERYGDHGLLRSAVVAGSARGTGIGSQITEERLDWSKAQGLRDVYLLTTTAAPFFEKLGFSRIDRNTVPAEVAVAPEFASICPSSAVVMRFDLT
ncbi:MAG TPA: arsenic resistance N-acetyltransferase ArsN2 [Longimicrobiales bacterium]